MTEVLTLRLFWLKGNEKLRENLFVLLNLQTLVVFLHNAVHVNKFTCTLRAYVVLEQKVGKKWVICLHGPSSIPQKLLGFGSIENAPTSML